MNPIKGPGVPVKFDDKGASRILKLQKPGGPIVILAVLPPGIEPVPEKNLQPEEGLQKAFSGFCRSDEQAEALALSLQENLSGGWLDLNYPDLAGHEHWPVEVFDAVGKLATSRGAPITEVECQPQLASLKEPGGLAKLCAGLNKLPLQKLKIELPSDIGPATLHIDLGSLRPTYAEEEHSHAHHGSLAEIELSGNGQLDEAIFDIKAPQGVKVISGGFDAPLMHKPVVTFVDDKGQETSRAALDGAAYWAPGSDNKINLNGNVVVDGHRQWCRHIAPLTNDLREAHDTRKAEQRLAPDQKAGVKSVFNPPELQSEQGLAAAVKPGAEREVRLTVARGPARIFELNQLGAALAAEFSSMDSSSKAETRRQFLIGTSNHIMAASLKIKNTKDNKGKDYVIVIADPNHTAAHTRLRTRDLESLEGLSLEGLLGRRRASDYMGVNRVGALYPWPRKQAITKAEVDVKAASAMALAGPLLLYGQYAHHPKIFNVAFDIPRVLSRDLPVHFASAMNHGVQGTPEYISSVLNDERLRPAAEQLLLTSTEESVTAFEGSPIAYAFRGAHRDCVSAYAQAIAKADSNFFDDGRKLKLLQGGEPPVLHRACSGEFAANSDGPDFIPRQHQCIYDYMNPIMRSGMWMRSKMELSSVDGMGVSAAQSGMAARNHGAVGALLCAHLDSEHTLPPGELLERMGLNERDLSTLIRGLKAEAPSGLTGEAAQQLAASNRKWLGKIEPFAEALKDLAAGVAKEPQDSKDAPA